MLELKLLGSPHILLDGRPVSGLSAAKSQALLFYLAVNGWPQTRLTLAGLLWPAKREADALANLRQALYHLRNALPDYMEINRLTVALNAALPCQVDALLFENQLAAQPEAVDLYTGEFLAGFYVDEAEPFDAWAVVIRERLHRLATEALHQLVTEAVTQQKASAGLRYANQWLALEPWREEAHRQLMRLLAGSGQRSAALSQYQTCRDLLATELGAQPDAETVALYQQIKEGTWPLFTAPNGPVAPESPPVAQPQPAVDLPEQALFGVAAARAELRQVLQQPGAPWLLALAGIGGIGKTTLATTLVEDLRRPATTPAPFAKLLWVSAKQEEFLPASGQSEPQRPTQPALDFATLIDEVLHQLDPQANLLAAAPVKLAAVQQHLRQQPHLLVVDNLETVADYATLLPDLRALTRPSKILITTRHLPAQSDDLFCYPLPELSAADAFQLLRHEGAVRGFAPLRQATDEQLQPIYRVVGGNPLALKLVVGQLRVLPLAQVLHNLQAAQGKKIEALYTYIYWQSWQLLDEGSRQLWLAMPIHPNVTFDHLLAVSGLDADELAQGLEQLVTLSLVELAGDLEERRYRLHRLTETFLLNEVMQWPTA